MVESRSKKLSIILFLLGIFILLVAVTASWITRMYTEQTRFSEASTLSAVECGRYYFSIDPDSVSYSNGTLYLEIRNSLGADIETIVIDSARGSVELNIGLGNGMTLPVEVNLEVTEWVMVYPAGCKGLNFKNISFEPKLPAT